MAREEITHKAGSVIDGMVSNNVPSEICDSYYRGFIEGATLADQTFIDKARKWLENRHNIEKYLGILTSKTVDLADAFVKAMEE